MVNRLCILLYLLLSHCAIIAQNESVQSGDSSIKIAKRHIDLYLENIDKKMVRIGNKVDKQMAKTLRRLQKQEAAIKRKFYKMDSLKACTLSVDQKVNLKQLEQRLQQTNAFQKYIPELDTLSTTLKFLQQNPQLLPVIETPDGIGRNLSAVSNLENNLHKAEQFKKFLKERREYLKDQLQSFGFSKELKKINKQAYYYSEELNQYKALLKDHKKAERKVIELLSGTKGYKNFMEKNSMLAALFRLPDVPDEINSLVNLSGLQTRAQINTLIQQQLGTNGFTQFQGSMKNALLQLDQLKGRGAMGERSSSEEEVADGFKPNGQKVKSFFKRLEYGTNIQSQKANIFFPTTSDIGLSLGYKLNDKSIVGIGGSYKIGWGNGWKNIKITSQGVGLRSFIDYKLKGNFWISGGYEQNYKTAFSNIDELRDQKAWQQSGLFGLSKVISSTTKFFKKTKLQMLWDFLSYQQVPRTQPLILRVAYSIR